ANASKENGVNADLKGAGRSVVWGLAAIAILVIVAVIIIGRETGPRQDREEVTVFCASSMSAVMNEIIDVFHRRSNTQINTRFGASEELLKEFTNDPGAVDLFFPGEAVYLERAGAGLRMTVELSFSNC
ncbi:MAG: substrate-binding domain-containing protein, partial [Candidatus Aminicenantes bacterium]